MQQHSDAHIAQELKAAVLNRCDIDAQRLAEIARSGVGQSKVSRGLTRELLVELKRRFKILPKERNVDGSLRTIDGARSFNKWLELHQIPKRNIFYVLGGRKQDRDFVTIRLTRREYRYLRFILRQPKNNLAKGLQSRFKTKKKKVL
jgi:hypothetical protein